MKSFWKNATMNPDLVNYTEKDFEVELETICFVEKLNWAARMKIQRNDWVYSIPLGNGIELSITSCVNPYRGVADENSPSEITITVKEAITHRVVSDPVPSIPRNEGWKINLMRILHIVIFYAREIKYCEYCKTFERINAVLDDTGDEMIFFSCKCPDVKRFID